MSKRLKAQDGGPNKYIDVQVDTQYAPSLNAFRDPVNGIHGYINGNIRGGGIVIWSKDEAAELAEELLDFAYGKPGNDALLGPAPDRTENHWPLAGAVVALRTDPKSLRYLQPDMTTPGAYRAVAHPDSNDVGHRPALRQTGNTTLEELQESDSLYVPHGWTL